jgi:hypothetical protein
VIRVLLVAPHFAELAGVSQEVYAVEHTEGLAVTRLPPDVRRRELLLALAGAVFEVLWLATHGSAEGVLLGDGEVVTGGDLVGLVRGAGLCGVVLASCQSVGLAELLHDETGVDVVCTVVDAPDVSAFQMGALFALYLGQSGDFRAAFDRARPGGPVSFRYVPEYRGALVVAPERFSFSTEELRTIYEAINEVRQRLSVVEVELRYMRQDLDSRRGDLRAPAQWVIVLVGLLMSLGLFVLLYFVAGSL